jgi:cytochrome b6-f complex iron-sulfur subunit
MSKPTSKLQPPPPATDWLDRRAFVRVALGGVGLCYAGAIGYPVYRYLASPVEKAAAMSAVTEVTLKDAEKLPVGSALMFKFGPRPSMLIHHKNGQWAAFDAVCTHLGCTVRFEPARDVIHCACHGGEYDPYSGKNVSGPPPKPLRKYVVKVVAPDVLVSRA